MNDKVNLAVGEEVLQPKPVEKVFTQGPDEVGTEAEVI